MGGSAAVCHTSRSQAERGVAEDTALTADDLKVLVGRYKQVYASLNKVRRGPGGEGRRGPRRSVCE